MKFDRLYQVDLHTHTVASGHAANTIEEMVATARERGITLYGITDHAKTMPGTAKETYFENLKNVSRTYDGIEVLLGVELNILDFEGHVDMSQELLKEMDVTIASIHNHIGYEAGSVEENTNAYIKVMQNPYINIIGHPDDGRVPVDYERLVLAARDNKKLLEVNNNSIVSGFRLNARDNDREMLRYCKKYRVPVLIGSDAHSIDVIGKNQNALDVIEEVGYDKNLIMNYHVEELKQYLNRFQYKNRG